VKLLAVETSGAAASVAMMTDGRILAECTLSSEGQRHAQSLVAEVGLMLDRLSIAAGDIDIVAVSVGPGSFTGLRVGVVFAKTFAWVNGAALVAVNTLQAAAQRVDSSVPSVTAIADAQRDEVFTAVFDWDSDQQLRTIRNPVQIVPVDQLRPEGMLTGPGLERFADKISDDTRVAETNLWHPTASAVAEIGQILAVSGDMAHPETLEPLYIRRSYAEEKR
jgi:tRNA threonylcarbamoyladenosine biosynthesis protein TsaB